MTYTFNRFQNMQSWLLGLLIGLAPFHAFLITWAKSLGIGGSLLFALSGWREVVAVLIMVMIALDVRTHVRLDRLDVATAAFVALGLIFLPFQGHLDPSRGSGQALLGVALSQWLLGFRFDIFPFLLLLFLRRVTWLNRERLKKIFFGTAFAVLIFGLLQAVILPKDFLIHFGYGDYQGTFDPELGISACQKLEHTDAVCRAISTFGGPTRYGTYLLLVLGMLVTEKRTLFRFTMLFLTLLNIALTFSRSIWIGLAGMSIFFFFWLIPRKSLTKAMVGAGLCALMIFAASLWYSSWQGQRVWPPPFLKTIFVRESSTDEHAKLLREGIALVKAHPFGMGLGTVGPASVRFEKRLTENWFLQIAGEMGVLGLGIYLVMLALFAKQLLTRGEIGLFSALLGIAVTGLFTHSFEETSTVLAIMAFSGLAEKRHAP